MSEPAIEVRNVFKYFGDFPALRGVSLEAPAGSILALLGRNGAGKTTLLHLFAGLSQPSTGEVKLAGASHEDLRRQVGFVGHGQWLYDDLTAEENLQFFGSLYGVDDLDDRIARWLAETGLERFRASRVNEFSRGMRQRLAIARAFLHDPRILLLDEPWTALDDRAIGFLSERIVEARAAGVTVVVCSHQLREALEVATEVAVLDRGKIAYRGPATDELKAHPDELYERAQ